MLAVGFWHSSLYCQCGPDILVCDEAHMIKNRRADITQALKQVRTQRRIALTGSPLQNNLMEYYCVRSRVSLLFCLLNHPVTEIALMFNTSSLPTYFFLILWADGWFCQGRFSWEYSWIPKQVGERCHTCTVVLFKVEILISALSGSRTPLKMGNTWIQHQMMSRSWTNDHTSCLNNWKVLSSGRAWMLWRMIYHQRRFLLLL